LTVDIVDSQNSQPTQNDKVDLFITKKVKAMSVNPVDRTAAGIIIDKAQKANIPVVFINREPLADDLAKWDKAFFVGAKAEESGTMEGEIIAEYWKAHPEADKNGDGVLQYVMLKGEPGHQDAELRTKFSVQAIQDAGIKVEKLAEDTAMWDRVKGQEKMAAFLSSKGDNIEAVLANNDDMALGAIEALKAAGYFKGDKYMPVVGVDATDPAQQALKEGTLLGTVLNDAENQGKATVELMSVLAAGETPTKENTGFEITDGKYVWIPYQKVTKESK
jgi:methyl-galactoside transport system substrate-binding protein